MPPKNRRTRRASAASRHNTEEAQEAINQNIDAIEGNLNNIKKVASQIDSENEEADVETTKKRHKTHNKKSLKESRRIVFILGALIGVVIAIYFGTSKEVGSDIDKLLNFDSIQDYIVEWKDMFPESIQGVLNDFELQTNRGPDFTESFAVGKAMKAEQGLDVKFPVILIPGVISTGLESWSIEGTPECPSQPHFRKRLWGSSYMLKTMFLDKACWLKHIMLDPETGLDPEGIKIRSAQGFEAADFFMAGYWIWSKIIENLSAIGYDPNKMLTAAYDWRLAYLDLERRDAYFTTLKSQIELQMSQYGERTVLTGHSMGSQVAFYFLKWVEAEGEHFGNGGPNWVNDHIAAYIDISGSMLGAPKAVTALLSGEMKDTVQLNALAVYGLEKFFSRKERLDMLRTFGGVPSMLPKGGDLIWGGMDSGSFDDEERAFGDNNDTNANFIRFDKPVGEFSSRNLTMGESIEYLLQNSPEWFRNRVEEQYSFGVAKTPEELEQNNQKYSTWSNPLEAPLPNAPDMKVFCFYGVGNPAERAYIYQEEENKEVSKLNVTIKFSGQSPVFMADGDGTIPLLSHSMCHKWKTSQHYNPGNSEVKIVEIKHDPDRFDIRGGPKTAEHVDILGSAELNELVLKVASGRDDLIEEKFHTNLSNWVSAMNFGKLN